VNVIICLSKKYFKLYNYPNEPCFYGSIFYVVTICGTYNAVYHDKCFVINFYDSTSRSICAEPSVAVLCMSWMSILFGYFLSDIEMFLFTLSVIAITFVRFLFFVICK